MNLIGKRFRHHENKKLWVIIEDQPQGFIYPTYDLSLEGYNLSSSSPAFKEPINFISGGKVLVAASDGQISWETPTESKSTKSTADLIIEECDNLRDLLLEKNAAYGDSALNPAGIFSKLNAVEAIKIRLDDKLKRIQNKGITDQTEDTLSDCLGYMILLKIALKSK